jgi:uncharacterized protein YeaC (DUF1315 family)
MEYNQLIAQLTPEVYLRLKAAIEIGKWPDGRVLSADQKASCLEAILRYQSMKLDPQQHSGYMTSARLALVQHLKKPTNKSLKYTNYANSSCTYRASNKTDYPY